jgi:magnesium transporter
VHAVDLEMDDPAFHERLLRIDLVVDGHALLSVHDRPLPFAPALEQRLSRGTRLQPCDASSLLHVFLDSLLDHYAQLAARLERRLEALEDRLLREPGRRALGDTLRVKRRVQGLRRLVAAFDEPLTTPLAPDSPLSGRDDGGLAPFRTLNQRHDQLLQRIDRIRDLAAGSYDLYLSSVSFRTNEQLKVLTFLSAVLLPMSVITGISGMSFQLLVFTDERFGWMFYAALGGMGLITVGLLGYFRARRWL